jgi:hypothetical protein
LATGDEKQNKNRGKEKEKKKIKNIAGPSGINVRKFEGKFSLDSGRRVDGHRVDLVLAAVLDARRVAAHRLAGAIQALALRWRWPLKQTGYFWVAGARPLRSKGK